MLKFSKQLIFVIGIVSVVSFALLYYFILEPLRYSPIEHWQFNEAFGTSKVKGICKPDAPNLRLNGPFTINLYVKNSALSTYACIMCKGYGDNSGGYSIYNNHGDLRFKRDNENIPLGVFTDAVNYHLLSFVYDKKDLLFYYDGSLANKVQISFSNDADRNSLCFGSGIGAGQFYGMVSDVRLYDIALDSRTVATLYLFKVLNIE